MKSHSTLSVLSLELVRRRFPLPEAKRTDVTYDKTQKKQKKQRQRRSGEKKRRRREGVVYREHAKTDRQAGNGAGERIGGLLLLLSSHLKNKNVDTLINTTSICAIKRKRQTRYCDNERRPP